MCLRKVCPQCNTIVHVKRSVCDCGHAFALKPEKEAQCTTVGEPENALKPRKTLLSEEELLVTKERQSPQSLNPKLKQPGWLCWPCPECEYCGNTKFERGGQGACKLSISY